MTAGGLVPRRDLAAIWGFPPRQRERCVWIDGHARDHFDALAPLLAELRERYPRIGVVLTSGDAGVRRRLGSAFPDAAVHPPPRPSAPVLASFLKRLNVRLYVALQDHLPQTLALERSLERRSVPVVACTGRGSAPRPARCELLLEEAALSNAAACEMPSRGGP